MDDVAKQTLGRNMNNTCKNVNWGAEIINLPPGIILTRNGGFEYNGKYGYYLGFDKGIQNKYFDWGKTRYFESQKELQLVNLTPKTVDKIAKDNNVKKWVNEHISYNPTPVLSSNGEKWQKTHTFLRNHVGPYRNLIPVFCTPEIILHYWLKDYNAYKPHYYALNGNRKVALPYIGMAMVSQLHNSDGVIVKDNTWKRTNNFDTFRTNKCFHHSEIVLNQKGFEKLKAMKINFGNKREHTELTNNNKYKEFEIRKVPLLFTTSFQNFKNNKPFNINVYGEKKIVRKLDAVMYLTLKENTNKQFTCSIECSGVYCISTISNVVIEFTEKYTNVKNVGNLYPRLNSMLQKASFKYEYSTKILTLFIPEILIVIGHRNFVLIVTKMDQKGMKGDVMAFIKKLNRQNNLSV